MTTTCNLGIDVITIRLDNGNLGIQSHVERFIADLQRMYNHGFAATEVDYVDDDDPEDEDYD